MKLSELISIIPHKTEGADIADVTVIDIAYDSRRAAEGVMFVCLVGETRDGHLFAADAYGKGCRLFLCQKRLDIEPDAIQIIVDDTRKAMALLSARFFGNPADKLKLIGVTGTKGKTTTVNLIGGVLGSVGLKAGIIGTNGIEYAGILRGTINTTPESYELHKTFADMVEHGVEYVAMEVSSIGIMHSRVYGINFDIGVFTNISPDHIGPKEHDSFEDYLSCKAELFKNCAVGYINGDDPNSLNIIKDAVCKVHTFGIHTESGIMAKKIEKWRESDKMGVTFDCDGLSFSLCTPGEFSVYNALAAISVCDHFGIPRSETARGLSCITVPGRMEVITALPDRTFVIDYAHNKLSLENALTTLKQYNPRRLVCLFGSVGGRSAMRRQELGKVAASLCDYCILTSDNPANEDPIKIIEDIKEGFDGYDCDYSIIADREEAVKYAVLNAAPGEVLLLAGKGHEYYQDIGDQKIPFSEKEIILKTAESVGGLINFC
ncbi:MAG: UDP-N-acetylmuramoyl-L-alanyl-D-glutamate--2,6-diaminopimelate ligase [Oscillospiraceae bacterium]|nr:UDP-N-acetylmuramoyl-L-alanyl-D-glutamate--2,6-diaminopimelate ligase [Oscillospiraceae bacterium]